METIPDFQSAKWIWFSNSQQGDDCDRVLFQRDFSLEELPSSAVLWFASQAFFRVELNGRLCLTGPVPHAGADLAAYAVYVDVSHLVDIGKNTLRVWAHIENVPLACVQQKIRGIWAQLIVDDGQLIRTDESWLCCRQQEYVNTGLRHEPGTPFLEWLDFRREAKPKFTAPDVVVSPIPAFGVLESMKRIARPPEFHHPASRKFGGKFHLNLESTWVDYGQRMQKSGASAGLFVAETWFYSEEAVEQDGLFFCDEPGALFFNDKQLFSQAEPSLPFFREAMRPRTWELSPHEYSSPSIGLSIRKGWNRLLVVQQCRLWNNQCFLVFPDIPAGSLEFRQLPDENAPTGWRIAGPLHIPMRLLFANFPFQDLPYTPWEPPAGATPVDMAAYYLVCQFENAGENTRRLPITLEKGDFLTLDFRNTRCVFPTVTLQGNAGDVVDIVCGEHLLDGEVVAFEDCIRRNVNTVVLKDGVQTWTASTPQGMRYIMLVARSAKERVTIMDAGIWQENMEWLGQGRFECSDPLLEDVWQMSVRTLNSTLQRIFLDSPTKAQVQTISDAMIQSWAAYYLNGAYDQAAQAIEAFAKSQLETGELLAHTPSGLFIVVPDFSLNWPVWLHRHIRHTGDLVFLRRMMPALKKLLFYYDQLALAPDGPIGNLKSYLGVSCFLDYGDIDKEGISSGLNAIYCRALLSAASLAEYLENQEQADLWRNRASSVSAQIREWAWDEEAGLFVDCIQEDGTRSEKHSWQTSILALYGGIALPEQYDAIWEKLCQDNPPMEKLVDYSKNNPYFQFYVLETAFAIGKLNWGVNFIKYYWGTMSRAGAVTSWEYFDPEVPRGTGALCARCCGYGVSPSAYLIQEVVGIRPAKDGMRQVYFAPRPGVVSWIRAVIPTPHGTLSVYWKLEDDGTFQVNISSNYPVEIVPVLDPAVASSATFTVSDEVLILGDA